MKPLLLLAIFALSQPLLVAQKDNAAIHGRVFQPNGQPATGIFVELVRASFFPNVQKVLMPTGKPTETDAKGEYRFAVAPGEYYIRTVTAPGGPQPRTYFPNTSEPGDAKAIQVSQGEDISADIYVSLSPVFKISGRIVDLLTDREPHYFSGVSLSSKNKTVQEYKLQNDFEGIPFCCAVSNVPDTNTSVTMSNDRFQIDGVRPGFYELNAGILVGDVKPGALVPIGKGHPVPYSKGYNGRITVEVTNADIADINIEVRDRAELNGRVVSNGKAVSTKESHIFLRSADNKPNYFEGAAVDKAGRFAFPEFQNGAYSIEVGGLPDDAYVVEIRYGGTKLSGTEFIVRDDKTEPLEIIVNPSGGTIDGHVQNGQQASIILLRTDGQARFDLVPIRRASQFGDFQIRGVSPGEYRIFAFKKLPADVVVGNTPISDFSNAYWTQGTTLIVEPGRKTAIGFGLIEPSVN